RGRSGRPRAARTHRAAVPRAAARLHGARGGARVRGAAAQPERQGRLRSARADGGRMHRRLLTGLLQRYAATGPDAAEIAARFLAFVSAHDDCLLRSCVPGHVTASAWILSPDGGACLLTRHRKLRKWLQLGGHVDGEERVECAALREAREESGL